MLIELLLPITILFPPSEAERVFALRKDQATRIAQRAVERTDEYPELQHTFSRLHERLVQNTQDWVTDPEVTASTCEFMKETPDENLWAFVTELPSTGRKIAFVCPVFYQANWIDQIDTIIHETFHLIGVDEECKAYALTFEVLTRAGLTPIDSTGKYSGCGISP